MLQWAVISFALSVGQLIFSDVAQASQATAAAGGGRAQVPSAVVPGDAEASLKAICIKIYRLFQHEGFKALALTQRNLDSQWLNVFKKTMNDLPPRFDDDLNQLLRDFLEETRDNNTAEVMKCKETVLRYLSLCMIEGKVQSGEGWRGRDVMNAIPENVRSAVQALVGRIFVIDSRTGAVAHTGSGIILPRDGGGFDHIVTCRHVMQAPDQDNMEEFRHYRFYFVRSIALSPDTTHGITVNAPSHLLKKPHTPKTYYDPGEDTLQTGCVHPDALMPFKDAQFNARTAGFSLGGMLSEYQNIFVRYLVHKSREESSHLVREIQSPGNFYQKDGAIVCPLKRPFDGDYMALICGDVLVQRGAPQPNQKICAIGFPNSPYVMDGMPTEKWGLCWAQGRTAPLTMTRAQIAQWQQPAKHDLFESGLVHTAPTAEGMSGGPILVWNDSTISLIGVVGMADALTNEYVIFSCG